MRFITLCTWLLLDRYIWLPMWAFDLPVEEHTQKAGMLETRGTVAEDAGAPRVDVVVQWFESWRLSDLDFSAPALNEVQGHSTGGHI